jgi:LPXTG-motif cell wall-anchored protein
VAVVRMSRLFVMVAALIVAAGVMLLGGGVAAAAPNPPGNNSTIKVDREPFDDHPDNQPHVGCVFQVDFYGYDEGALFANVTFESHPPTGPVVTLLTDTVFIGEDDNSGGGSEAGLDASETYTLDFTGIEPHPNQGFHVKLTVHADGSQGADTKYKVFWVTGCGPGQSTTTTSGTTTTTTSGGTTTTSGETTTSTGPSSSVGGPTTTMPGSSVGGSNASAGGGGGASGTGGVGLASTGSNAVALLAAGLSILGIGVATLLGVRRRRSLAAR